MPISRIESMLHRYERSVSVELILGGLPPGYQNHVTKFSDVKETDSTSIQSNLADDQQKQIIKSTADGLNDNDNTDVLDDSKQSKTSQLTIADGTSNFPVLKISQNMAAWLRDTYESDKLEEQGFEI